MGAKSETSDLRWSSPRVTARSCIKFTGTKRSSTDRRLRLSSVIEQRRNLTRRDGFAEQIALTLDASGCLEAFEVSRVFDSFRRRCQPEALGEPEDCAHD